MHETLGIVFWEENQINRATSRLLYGIDVYWMPVRGYKCTLVYIHSLTFLMRYLFLPVLLL